MQRRIRAGIVCVFLVCLFSSCVQAPDVIKQNNNAQPNTTICVAAAASLETIYETEIIPLFVAQYPHIAVEGVYDSSGKLQTQIEEGLPADIFMPASWRQMQNLAEQALVSEENIVPLLQNEIVLIQPKGHAQNITEFKDITFANNIALGDPESVPAGQYAKEALVNVGAWEEVALRASYGSSVTEVLNWVAEGSADVGIVYATDAAQKNDKVEIIAKAPNGFLEQPVIYPVAVLSASEHTEEAMLFLEFLQTQAIQQIFIQAGFTLV